VAVKARKGVMTAPASANGTVSVDLTGDGFSATDPLRAIIFWAEGSTAEEVAAANAVTGRGVATHDGGAIQQWCIATTGSNNQGTTITGRGNNTNGCILQLVNSSATATAVDLKGSVTTWTDTGFTVTFSSTVSGRKIHYMAWGGSNITAARAFSYTCSVAAATQNITINTGFGQPDLVLWSGGVAGSLADAAASSGNISFGAGYDDTHNRTSAFTWLDNQATSALQHWQGNALAAAYDTSGTFDAVYSLSARASWPTDGIQIAYSDQAAAATEQFGLALKGDFTVALGSSTAPTAAAPQTTTHSLASGTARAALVWGGALGTTVGNNATDNELGGFFFGGTDGTNEGCIGVVENDGDTTEWNTRIHSESKVYRLASGAGQTVAGTPSPVTSDADSSLSGGTATFTWGDTDTVAREYNWLVIGEPGSALSEAGTSTFAVTNTAAEARREAATSTVVEADTAATARTEPGTSTLTVANTAGEARPDAGTSTLTLANTGADGRGEAATSTLAVANTGTDARAEAATSALAVADSATSVQTEPGTSTLALANTAGEARPDAGTSALTVANTGAEARAETAASTVTQTDTAAAAAAEQSTSTLAVANTGTDARAEAATSALAVTDSATSLSTEPGTSTLSVANTAAEARAETATSTVTAADTAAEARAEATTSTVTGADSAATAAAEASTSTVTVTDAAASVQTEPGTSAFTIASAASEQGDEPVIRESGQATTTIVAATVLETAVEPGTSTATTADTAAQATAERSTSTAGLLDTAAEAAAERSTSTAALVASGAEQGTAPSTSDSGTSALTVTDAGAEALGERQTAAVDTLDTAQEAALEPGTSAFTITALGQDDGGTIDSGRTTFSIVAGAVERLIDTTPAPPSGGGGGLGELRPPRRRARPRPTERRLVLTGQGVSRFRLVAGGTGRLTGTSRTDEEALLLLA
jgi:hypothetical protein